MNDHAASLHSLKTRLEVYAGQKNRTGRLWRGPHARVSHPEATPNRSNTNSPTTSVMALPRWPIPPTNYVFRCPAVAAAVKGQQSALESTIMIVCPELLFAALASIEVRSSYGQQSRA